MRGAYYLFVSVLAAALLMLPLGIIADSFIDNTDSDWDDGTATNMTVVGHNLTLALNDTNEYYSTGGFVSQLFDAGEIVLFGVFNWSIVLDPVYHAANFNFSCSNDSEGTGPEITATTNDFGVSVLARYFQYYINITNSNNESAPNITGVEVSYDTVDPWVSLDLPGDDHTIDNSSDVDFDCSAGSINNMTGITFYWDYSGSWEANGTDALTGPANSTSFARGNLSDGTYIWNCMAGDSAGHSSWGASNRTLIVETVVVPPVDAEAPSIDDYSVAPQAVANGSQVTIRVEASDNDAVDSVWAVVDYPGSGQDLVMLTNDANTAYDVTLLGRHNVTIFANDTSGNTTNVTDYFVSISAITIDIEVSDDDGDGEDSEVVIYEEGTTDVVDSFSSSTGDFSNKVIPNGTYDLQFSAFDGELVVLLEEIEMWENTDNRVGMDNPTAASGYEITYAVETDYAFDGDAVVRIYYDEDDMNDEGGLFLYMCDDWNFSGRFCNSIWNETDATLNESGDYFELTVPGFSAFSIKQDSYCGDGTCDSNEDSTDCPADCICDDGDTRLCSLNSQGRCAVGSETCTDGSWSGCPSPVTETCNQQDDDCDGVVDNVGGAHSIETTLCGCYNGSSPSTETFDGIDNNCNGFIDDGCVCNESETDVCGSNIGVCSQGTKTCINCRWGDCVGDVGPYDEVCGNGLDDDCDGNIDELADCIIQTNVTCGYGAIPSTGCKCGLGMYSSGYCCDGVYGLEPCPEFPWWILIIVGAVVLAVVIVYYFLHEKAKGSSDDQWKKIEKKYTPAKM